MSTNVTKLVKLQSVLLDVFRIVDVNDGITVDDVIEAAAEGWTRLYNYKIYEDKIVLKPVNNYKAEMPNDWQRIHSVQYKKHLTEDEITNLLEYIETVTVNNEDKDVIEKKQVAYSKMSKSIVEWEYMKVGHNNITLSRMSEGSPNLSCTSCLKSFTVQDGCTITTSECDGYVLITYQRAPRDSDGDFLIPNLAKVNAALKSFCLMSINEKLWHMGEQGAEGKFKYYARDWAWRRAAAIGDMKRLNLAEYYSVVTMNKYFHNDPYATIFAGHGFERTNMTNF